MNTEKAIKILKKHNVEIVPARGVNPEPAVICDGVFSLKEIKAIKVLLENNTGMFSRKPKKKQPEYEDWMTGK